MKQNLGAVGFVVGLLGAMFAVGGVENAQTVQEWVIVAGVTVTSLMLMQVGVWMLNDKI
jgi:hypothetical protein